MSTAKEVKLNYDPVDESYDNDDTIRFYRDEVGDDDYDYINNNHSSYNDEYYD